jgi:ABC-type transport system involved in cytochrome bd biosynthesis fused ATPase/permease subunit
MTLLLLLLQDTAQPGPSGPPPAWVGYAFVVLLFVTSLMQTALLHQYFFRVFRVGQHLRSSIILAVYQKSLRLSLTARQGQSVGTITNLMSTDSKRLQDLTTYLMMVVSGPLQIVLSVYFLWQQIGVSVFGGVAVIVLFLPINGFVGKSFRLLNCACFAFYPAYLLQLVHPRNCNLG